MLLQGLKPRIFNRLNKFGARWLAELPAVLWSLRTTPSRATGYTPFFMVYGSEVSSQPTSTMERQESEHTTNREPRHPTKTPWTS